MKHSIHLSAFAAFFIALVVQTALLCQPSMAGETDGGTEKSASVILKVMTINVRHNSDFWEERFPLVADEIVRLRPDLIGLQEVQITSDQSNVLLKLIEERDQTGELKYEHYEELKTGFNGVPGEGIAIFSRFPIKTEKIRDLITGGRPLLMTRVEVNKDLTLDFYNTHLHNRGGDEVRQPQAKLSVGFINKNSRESAVFLTGDLNSTEDSETIQFFHQHGFRDAYREVHGDKTDDIGNTSPISLEPGSFDQKPVKRIDYIFCRPPKSGQVKIEVMEAVVAFKNYNERGLYPSDHLGVMATFRLDY